MDEKRMETFRAVAFLCKISVEKLMEELEKECELCNKPECSCGVFDNEERGGY